MVKTLVVEISMQGVVPMHDTGSSSDIGRNIFKIENVFLPRSFYILSIGHVNKFYKTADF